jgi:transcriptional regulator with XRE-family HTH domain
MSEQIKITSEEQAGRTLGDLRRNARLRQSDLAAKVHVGISALRDREHGRRGLHVRALVDTAAALGFDVVLVPRRPEEQP